MFGYFWGKFFPSFTSALLVALITGQICIAPLALAQGDEEEPATKFPRPPIEVVVGGTGSEAEAQPQPGLEKLRYEIDSGMVRGADPEALAGQHVTFKTGLINSDRRDYPLEKERTDVPKIHIRDFFNEINARNDNGNLVIDHGHWERGVFKPNGTSHSHKQMPIEGKPAVDSQFIAVAGVNWHTNAQGGEEKYLRIRLMSALEFTGYAADDPSDTIAQHGFNRPLSFYSTSIVKLPEGARVMALEFYGPQSRQREFEGADPTHPQGIEKTGDLLIDYELADGTKRTAWISRETLLNHLEVSLQFSVLWRAVHYPTAANLTRLRGVFAGRDTDYQNMLADVKKEHMSKKPENALIDWALSSKLRSHGEAWVTSMLKSTGDPKAQTVIAQMAKDARQELPADTSEDSLWSQYQRVLKQAEAKDPTYHAGPHLENWGTTLLKTQYRLQQKTKSWWEKTMLRGLIFAKNSMTSTTGMVIWGTTLLTTAAAMNPENPGTQFVSALGSRLYEWASGEGVLNSGVAVFTGLLSRMSGFVGENLQTTEGYYNLLSVAGTMAFYVALLPAAYLLLELVNPRKFLRDPSPNRIIRDGFSRFCKFMAVIVYPMQKIFWEQVANQKNLYLVLESGRNPFNYRQAWNSPAASPEQIAVNRLKLERRLEREKILQEASARIMALAICERHYGIPMATLDMSAQVENISQFLELLGHDSQAQAHWIKVSQGFYESIRHLAQDEVQLDPKNVANFVSLYVKQAEEVHARLTESSSRAQRFFRTSRDTVKRFFKEHVLQWAVFGKPGLEQFHNNWNMELTQSQAEQARNMILADYPAAVGILASSSLQDWIWPGQPRIASAQGETLLGWSVTAPNDVVATSEAAAAENNPYRPLATLEIDPRFGAVREQTLDSALAQLADNAVSGKEGAPGILNTWHRYMYNAYRLFQGRLILAGVPMTVGFALMSNSDWAEKLSHSAGWVSSTPVFIQVPIMALFTSAWYHLVKYQWGNYATVWPVVTTIANVVRKQPGSNLSRMKRAISLLVSKDPAQFREGAKLTKQLYAETGTRIPEELNKDSDLYTEEDARKLYEYQKAGKLPLTNKENFFLDFFVANFVIGAVGSTALYDLLSAQGLFSKTTDPVTTATVVAAKFAAYLVGLGLINKGLNKFVWPKLEKSYLGLPSVHKTVSATISGVAAVRDVCKRTLGRLVGIRPQTINVE